MKLPPPIVGTAGWSIPVKDRDAFPPNGTALQRYGHVLRGAEINSSFHRPHRASTWARWAASVPETFRFSVKLPRTITHQAKLSNCGALTRHFIDDVSSLGAKLAVLLVQLPPKLDFHDAVVSTFFAELRELTDVCIACEPRHISWFGDEADALLRRIGVARVAADPALAPIAAVPGGWRGLSYRRLHGSPVMYRSRYTDQFLDVVKDGIAQDMRDRAETWCIFDNTAGSAAMENALDLIGRLAVPGSG